MDNFYEGQNGGFVHKRFVERVMAVHFKLGSFNILGENEILIIKLLLGVTGVDAKLLMDVILLEQKEDGNASRQNVRVENGMQGEEERLPPTQVDQLKYLIADVGNQLEHCDLNSHTMLCHINQNLSCLVVTPGQRLVADSNAGNINPQSTCGQAILTKKLTTLHDLWVEWEFGLWGNKAAKDFTLHMRGGKNEYKFYLRKYFWCLVSKMGRSSQAAQVMHAMTFMIFTSIILLFQRF